MARIRSIKPEFFMHEGLADLSPMHRLLFIGLWTLADRRGRLEDRPKRIKAALFPWDALDVEAVLVDLDRGGFILRYEAGGKRCINIPSFLTHQKPHPKEAEYDLPDPDPSAFGREISRLAGKRNGEPGKGVVEPEKGDDEQRGVWIMENGSGSGERTPHPAPAAAQKPGELRDGVEAEFLSQRGSAYEWTSQDENALRSKIQHGTPEILRRWRIALSMRYPRCSSVLDLVRKWNDYAAEDAQTNGNGPPSREVAVGRGSGGGGACATCGEPAEAIVRDKPSCYRCAATEAA